MFLDKTLLEFTEKDCSDFPSTFCVQHRSLIHQAIGSELLSGSLIGHKYPVIVVVIAGVRLCYDSYVRLKQRKRLFFQRLFSHIVFTVFYSAEHFTAPHWAKTTYSKRAFSFSKTKSIVCMKFVRHLCPRPAPARESFSFMKESSRREPAQPSVPITNNGDHSAENRNSEMPTWLELEYWNPSHTVLRTETLACSHDLS